MTAHASSAFQSATATRLFWTGSPPKWRDPDRPPEEVYMSTKKHMRHARFNERPFAVLDRHPDTDTDTLTKLELVVKSDVAGTAEAVVASLDSIRVPGVHIQSIKSGVGPISKSDVLMAQTGSRLVVGFNVDVVSKMQSQIKDLGVEIRLYDTIYQLTADIKKIAERLVVTEPQEVITGKAKVIATFKAKQKGIIIGCEVTEGVLEKGKALRVITAMGPAYSGTIGSLQIENHSVKIATEGQQVGIEIRGWKKAKIGDWVECYEMDQPKNGQLWQANNRVLRFKS
jgi:translation initiation factor IF-2